MNSIEKLNNLIKSIESSKEQRKLSHTAVNFDNISFDNLDIEIIVGSKVEIQSENNFSNDKTLLLEDYLKSISKYKKYRNKSPRYKLETKDLTLDINLELEQKYLVETPIRMKKTPADIKRDISITLLENLKTSIFLYKNLDKKSKYKASFDDLTLDIEVDLKKERKYDEKLSLNYKNISKTKEKTIDSKRIDKINILKEKLSNIEKFRQEKHGKRDLKSNIDIGVTLTKSGEKIISVNRDNKVNKLKQILESINSYREKRDGLYK